MSTPQLEALAFDLASDGIAGHELAIRQVVRAARTAGPSRVPRTLVDILADPAEPEVARLRAFGTIALAISRVPVDHDAAA